MDFMEPQVCFGSWYEVETNNGTEIIPTEVVGQLDIERGEVVGVGDARWAAVAKALRLYCEGEPQSVRLIEGFGARLSASGYIDCTPWAVFETNDEAWESLAEADEGG